MKHGGSSMKLSWNIEKTKFRNAVATSKNYTVGKKGLKVQKRFPKYGGKDYLCKFGFLWI